MKHIVACLLLCLAPGCSSSASEASSRSQCGAPHVTGVLAARLARQVAGDSQPSAAELADLQVTTTGVLVGKRCAVAATVSYGNQLSGGVAIFSDTAALASGILLALDSYPGADAPFSAGNGRIGFTYVNSRGSGFLQETTMVLCALDEAAWVPCASAITRIGVSGVGTASTVGEALSSLVLQSTTEMRGDTLVIRSISRSSAAGGPANSPPDSSVSRIVLPRAPVAGKK